RRQTQQGRTTPIPRLSDPAPTALRYPAVSESSAQDQAVGENGTGCAGVAMRSDGEAVKDVAPAAAPSLKHLTQLAVVGICVGTAAAGSTTSSSSAPRGSPATDAR
ncbi:unnamed protein product, partial [Ectocarpus sp. 13 AM-2016]